jgi:hypothetical protein
MGSCTLARIFHGNDQRVLLAVLKVNIRLLCYLLRPVLDISIHRRWLSVRSSLLRGPQPIFLYQYDCACNLRSVTALHQDREAGSTLLSPPVGSSGSSLSVLFPYLYGSPIYTPFALAQPQRGDCNSSIGLRNRRRRTNGSCLSEERYVKGLV